MTRPQIELDFARKRPRVNRIGAALFAAGILGAALVIADYRGMAAESDGLEMRLAAISPDPDAAIPDPAAMRVAEEARAAVSELATPWSILLEGIGARKRGQTESGRDTGGGTGSRKAPGPGGRGSPDAAGRARLCQAAAVKPSHAFPDA